MPRTQAHETPLLGGRGPAAGGHGRRSRVALTPGGMAAARARRAAARRSRSSGSGSASRLSGGQLSASLVALVLAMGLLGPAPAVACGIAAMVLHSAVRRRAASPVAEQSRDIRRRRLRGRIDGARRSPATSHDAHSQHLAQSIVFGLIVLRRRVRSARAQLRPVRAGRARRGGSLARAPGARAVPPAAPRRARRGRARDDARGRLHERRPARAVRRDRGAVDLPAPDGRAAALRGPRRAARSALAPARLAPAGGARDARGGRSGCATRRPGATRPRSPATRRRWRSSSAATRTSRTSSTPPACSTTSASSRGPTASCTPSAHRRGHGIVIRATPRTAPMLVGTLDGYGPVADAILYHHERVDGGGYPAGLIGKRDPAAPRGSSRSAPPTTR